MTLMPHPASHRTTEETVRRQIAQATLRLRHYRLARDRARSHRLRSAPQLEAAIAALLGTQS